MARQDQLISYRSKRDFNKTPEPKGIPSSASGHRYLIQKHAASRLHYDFRLELDGVLKSWAVTRGPSLDPNDKRLAVQVEDHPLEYGSFEGTIPKGQYGGGTVMLWDEGEWAPIGDPHAGLTAGKLVFALHGKRLKGEWTLVRMRPDKKNRKKNNWLLIKHRDALAREGEHDTMLAQNVTSVVSGKTMDEIASSDGQVWQSNATSGFIPPQLATLTDAVPQGRQWVHEIKFDGYRALACLRDGKARIFTRNGQDWTHKFRPIAALLETLPARSAVLDGEIVALSNGASSFRALQEALSKGESEALQYYVFDMLELNGKDLRGLPLLTRKKKLLALIGKELGGRVFYSEHFAEGDQAFLKHLCALRMEGLVSKRTDAPYSSGRGKSWLKIRCHRRQEFVIGGFTAPKEEKLGIRALLLGYFDKGKLIYAGKVGTGFDHETSRLLRKKLELLKQKVMPFTNVPADAKRNAFWVSPQLACEVEFTEWTGKGRLRHPSFQGLREDKPAGEIRHDSPLPSDEENKKKNGDTIIGSIRISHPDRIIYPGEDITKQRLAEYYLEVGGVMLPYVAGRPLSMIRCPDGIASQCFFQRHIPHEQPSIYNVAIKIKNRTEQYVMIKDMKGLITLVQWGVIELHPWGCLADKPDLPDRIIFDLDPDPALAWTYVIEAAKEIRARMQEFGLESFVKTTGGKGLHVTVPLVRQYGWAPVKSFARAIAESMEHDNRKRYIAKASKAARHGKIFVDYLRNDATATAVAPFSARARQGAPVATPLGWRELVSSLDPSRFTISTVPERLKRLKSDPWEDFLRLKQKLSPRFLSALNIEI